MFLALVMACSLYVEDDCKVFKDTRGFHMTEESCVERAGIGKRNQNPLRLQQKQ